MAENFGRPIAIPKEKQVEFRKLTESPALAVPTIILALVLIPGVMVSNALAVFGQISLFAAMAINIVLYYFFFTIIHDGVHRSISSNKTVNDFVCQLSVTCYAPYAPMHLFRWAHMEHHRFTNDEMDPDDWSHGPWWALPFKWMTIDLNYGWRAITSSKPATRKVLKQSLPYMIGGMLFIAGVIIAGYGYELLILWFIPSRLAFIGIGFSFFWLPHAHAPNENMELRQSKNYTIATTVRVGGEAVLNPLLQYQNYHLIHHLWPTTPFYNNERVWRLLEPELRRRDLAIAAPFKIQPDYEFAPETLEGAYNA